MPHVNSGDTSWVLTSTALVLFMTPGLAFYYGGMVRRKNVLGMLMQNYVVMGIVVEHYQRGRPHRRLALGTPIGPKGRAGTASPVGAVRRRDLLGGHIHEYSRTAT